ncbi:helix-turn-helix domain-containing protein [Desulfotruncus alcoholivorax]|uniref:helix-turn-helix domain-containing protein n=1 Tax=Desulfotruncus alcoholivorax TaxID=265477 RepID=UPI000482CC6E|nr:helix-turn-helix transcriptional regulator [Desulfotruncus alcoholivorax]
MVKLIYLRQTKGFTQEQLAKILKISPGHLSNIESGRRNPSWEVAQRLEQFFGIPASELLAESKQHQQ